MSFIQSPGRSQFMLPSLLDEYVSDDNPVRIIDTFVERLVANTPPEHGKGGKGTGRPAYKFSTLLKIYVYGYLNSVTSSRRLERECLRNLEVIWLTENLHPDHKTISDFRRDHKEDIRRCALSFRRFLKETGYMDGGSVVTDGTKVKAYASRDTLSLSAVNQRLERMEAELDRYLSQLDESDRSETFDEHLGTLADDLGVESALLEKIAELQARVAELEKHRRFMEEHGVAEYAPSDPEARVMKTRQGFMPAYNVQMTVDTKHHLIAQMDVTDHPNDFDDLQPNVSSLKEVGIEPSEVLADAGYANEEQGRALEGQGVSVYVPFPESGQERKDGKAGLHFAYDEAHDRFVCPEGRHLVPVRRGCLKRGKKYDKYQCGECEGCPRRDACTSSRKGRIIYRRQDGQWLADYKARMKSKPFKEKLGERKKYVEHPFGTIKYRMGQIPLLLRGREKVQAEIDLHATCYNLKRLLHADNRRNFLSKVLCWG